MQLGALGTLSSKPKFDISLNDISTVEFEMPKYYYDKDIGDYIETHLYNEVVGKKLLRIDPYGWFRIVDPKVQQNHGEHYSYGGGQHN